MDHQPSFSSESLTPLDLVVGPVLAKTVVLLSGAGALVAGTLLGKITLGAVSKAAKSGGNTGNGTLTMDSTNPKIAGAKLGAYTVRVIRAAIAAVGTTPAVPAQAGIAQLKDPDGNILETFDIPTTPGITISNQVKFVMVEGATPFALGDGFDITIAAGSGKYVKSLSTVFDGSQYPDCILAEDADATSADKTAPAYYCGEFNSNAMTFGADHTAATVAEQLRILGIHLKASVAR